MNNLEKKRIFFHWLKKHNIYDKFQYETKHYCFAHNISNCYLDDISASSISSFCWAETQDGNDFWNMLYKNWSKYYFEHNLDES